MTEWIRPGPEHIAPHLAPDGIVFHLYDVPGGELLIERKLRPSEDLMALAEMDAAVAGAASSDGVCIVVFDGDTGERWTPAEISQAWEGR